MSTAQASNFNFRFIFLHPIELTSLLGDILVLSSVVMKKAAKCLPFDTKALGFFTHFNIFPCPNLVRLAKPNRPLTSNTSTFQPPILQTPIFVVGQPNFMNETNDAMVAINTFVFCVLGMNQKNFDCGVFSNVFTYLGQSSHGEFEPGRVQYSTQQLLMPREPQCRENQNLLRLF